jgi:spore coat polysaccharide biosynthesis protein SpsF
MRAGNKGHAVVLATTDRKVDNQLCMECLKAGVEYYRGDAQDVRSRFLGLCHDLADDSIIVRLTADNLLPDGELIGHCIQEFRSRGGPYLNLGMIWKNPPYGLSIELMQARALREAASVADTPAEREHVTPFLVSRYATHGAPADRFSPEESAIRCTMDNFDDYREVTEAFEDIGDPVNVSWSVLLSRMSPRQCIARASQGPPLIVGTAQIAAPYGSIRKVHPPSEEEAIRLLTAALEQGASGIDTAQAYGGSERVVGLALGRWRQGQVQVTTKLSPLAHLSPSEPEYNVELETELSVLRSVLRLGRNTLPDVLLHRVRHLHDWNGAAWRRLLKLSDEGTIGRVGVSVQSPAEAIQAVDDEHVKIIQLPFNVLDWSWEESFVPYLLERRDDITIHVRSVYLQGVLLGRIEDWPSVPGVDPGALMATIRRLCDKFERQSIEDFCVAWARSKSWIHGIVVGMEEMKQLESNLSLFRNKPLTEAQAREATSMLPRAPVELLNPALWNLHQGASST